MAELPGAVLFGCTMNANRSVMAEGLMKRLYGHAVYIDSVGVRRGELDPFAAAVMDELGIDITRHRPKTFDDLEDVPSTSLLPAFMLSELRTAFEIGFMIYLPFLVIDLIIASMLISMGMIVLPPIVISLPFKLMLFVLMDGWNRVVGSLVDGLI